MEPEFVREQVKNVWRVLCSNEALIQERNLIIEGAFVGPDFVVNQASVLYDAVTDSVNLKANHAREHQFVIMRPEFLSQQGNALKAAIDDSARLQDTSKTTHTGLSSLTDTFILGMVNNLRDVMNDNSTVALQYRLRPNVLSTCSTSFTTRLTAAFSCALESYVVNRRGLAILQEERTIAERTYENLKQQAESATVDKTAAVARIAELEASMLALQQRCDHLQTTAKDAANLEAQIRISKLEDELACVSSQHMMCSSTVQRCDAELASLKQEHKSLVQAHEDQRRAAAESAQQVAALRGEKEELERERDRLGAELTQQHNAHESFVFCQDKKHEKATAEITRLQDIIRARETAVNTVAEEKMQLKAALDASQTELLQTQNQLAATIVQRDTWKVELEEVLARQGIDAEQMLQPENAAEEQQNADALLHNAGIKIEALELQLRQKDTEITRLRQEVARKAQEQRVTDVSQRPPTALVPSSSTAVKRAVEEERAIVSVSASQSVTWAFDLAAHGSPMPLGRVKELATLPTIAVDLGPGQEGPAIFTRQSLSSILGGSIQGLVVRCTESATELARKHGISTYLCPNMDHNAWSPPAPGKHGYMQVGLGRDRDLFNNGEYRHVFVGAGKYFVYCGWYHVLRVERLTQDEWTTLPPKVQTTYSQTTVNKEKSSDFKSAQHVLAMYNSGELRAPCVRLQCVGFDTAFYQELVRSNDRYFEHEPRPMPPANAAGGSTKRRRVSKPKKVGEDFEEEGSLAVAVASIKSATPNGATGPEPTLTASAPLASVSAASQTVVARPDVTVDVPTASHLSASAGPSTQAPADPPRRSTRLLGRRQAISSATFTLRIPSGKIKDRTSQSMERGESDVYLSSGLDDDDVYADM